MDWQYRLTGLVVLFLMIFGALIYGAEQLASPNDSQAQAVDNDRHSKRTAAVSPDEPELLAFTEGGFSAGSHRIKPNPAIVDATRPRSSVDFGLGNRGEDDEPGDGSGDDFNSDSGTDSNDNDSSDDDLSSPVDDEPGLEPGLYTTTFDTEECSYQLIAESDNPFDVLYEPDPFDDEYRGTRVGRNDRSARIIGEDHLRQGRLLVTINDIEPTMFHSSPGCDFWMPWTRLRKPLATAGNGDYWRGDLVQGEWSVPSGCLWEKVAAFRGGRLDDVIASGVGPGSIMIDEGTHGVRIRNCQNQVLTRIGAAAAYVPYVHPGVGEELDTPLAKSSRRNR